jgi:hypothetical protein
MTSILLDDVRQTALFPDCVVKILYISLSKQADRLD